MSSDPSTSTTFEFITDLFKSVDIIMLPIVFIMIGVIQIYNTVKNNKQFNKTYDQKNKSNELKTLFNTINNDLIKKLSVGDSSFATGPVGTKIHNNQESTSYVINQTQY